VPRFVKVTTNLGEPAALDGTTSRTYPFVYAESRDTFIRRMEASTALLHIFKYDPATPEELAQAAAPADLGELTAVSTVPTTGRYYVLDTGRLTTSGEPLIVIADQDSDRAIPIAEWAAEGLANALNDGGDSPSRYFGVSREYIESGDFAQPIPTEARR
jgi:hypothetical protein